MDGIDRGYEVTAEFERFSQVNDVFSRSMWDPQIRDERTDRFFATYRRPLTEWRRANGFTQKDYAVRNASWHVTDIFAELYEADDRRDGFLDDLSMLRESASEKLVQASAEAAATELKHVATTFGADLIGITGFDERWQYTERFSTETGDGKPNDIGDGLDHVVVIAQHMDADLIQTAPSALAGTATGLGYSHDAVVLLAVAQYIRNLGYRAVPSMNDTAIAIPYAIAAGLGSYGRHGMLITREFGPRVRLGKIFTDLPLSHDRPIDFGVNDFCQDCDRCATACPARAIPKGEPTSVALNRSGIVGVTKWSVDGEACFGYWSKINSDCAICVRVCPWTRDYAKASNRLWRRLAGSRFRKLALQIDDLAEGGKRLKPNQWWAQRRNHPITDRARTKLRIRPTSRRSA